MRRGSGGRCERAFERQLGAVRASAGVVKSSSHESASGTSTQLTKCLRFTQVRGRVWVLLYIVCMTCAPQRGTVGARFGRDTEGQLVARYVPEGLGAANAGMKAGDKVLLIDGRDVRPLSDAAVHSVLSGDYGTRVRLTILRGEEVLRLSVIRTMPPASPRQK